MAPDAIVRVEGLRVSYGDFEAVRNVSFTVNRGTAFGLVGPNGAGKTSTLKVLAGLLRPTGGRASVAGHDVALERDAMVRRIGYMADFFGVYDYLTVYEYLEFFGGMYAISGDALVSGIDAAISRVALETKRHARIATLSRGMKQRLYLARALVHGPEVLILDEPASGMDPRGRDEMVRMLGAMAMNGTTILISSHILDELQDLCTVIGVMETGRLVGLHKLGEGPDSAASRRYRLLTPAGDVEKARALAAGLEAVSQAEPATDGVWLTIAGGEQSVSEVVRAMVHGGVRVLLPPSDASDLKDMFLRMTKGELM